jgi:DNA repair protein RadC
MDYFHPPKRRSLKRVAMKDRPREKFFAYGPEYLRDEELIALIINSGTKDKDVLMISAEIVKKFPLTVLPRVTTKEMAQQKGLGPSKIARLRAVGELGRRMFVTNLLSVKKVETVEAVIQESQEIIEKSQEYLLALYMNTRNELLKKEIIGIGSLNINIIQPREIFGPAINIACNSIIIAHNHPSGDPTPSPSDIEFTEQVKSACDILGYEFLDHVIVGSTGFVSFRRLGYLS